MSVGVHADISGNLSICAPGAGHTGPDAWTDADLFLDYGGPYVPLGTPILRDEDDNASGGSLVNSAGIFLPSPGLNLDVDSYYHSNSAYNGPFGYGHTLTPNIVLRASITVPTVVEITRGNGNRVSYLDSGCGVYQPQTPGLLNKLEQDVENQLWLEKTPDGRTMAFPLDISGRVTTITWAEDSVGNRHTFSYSSGRLSSLQDAVGRSAQFRYTTTGLPAPAPSHVLMEIEDWAGRITTFSYDTASVTDKPLVSTISGPAGYQSIYDYDDKGRMTSVKDANNNITTYAYDDDYRVTGRTVTGFGQTQYAYGENTTAMIDPRGARATHTFDSQRRLSGWQGPHGTASSFTRNTQKQITRQQDALNRSWTTTYNSAGVPTGEIDPLSHVTTITRDYFNNAIEIKYWDGAIEQMDYTGPFDDTGEKRRLQVDFDALGAQTVYSYNSLGQVSQMENAVGKATTYVYDGYGNRTGSTDWLGNATAYDHDDAGNATTVTDPLGRNWTYTFDGQNRRLTATDPENRVTTTVYDNVGNVVSQIDDWGNATTYTYNIWDQPTQTVNALGHITTTLYDQVGRPVVTIDPLNCATTTVYDLAGRAVNSVNPLKHVTTTIYGTTGLVDDTVNYLGFTTTYEYDAIGRVTAVSDPLGHTTETDYDLFDSATHPAVRSIDGAGIVTTSVYDFKGQLIASIDQHGYRNTTVYDAIGRIRASEDALHQRTTWTYDLVNGDGMLETLIEDARGKITTTTYDENSRVFRTENELQTTITVYDRANRVSGVFDPKNKLTVTNYDLFDSGGAYRAMTVQTPKNNATTTVYDKLHRTIATVNPRGERSTTVYDKAGQVTNTIDSLGNRTTTVYDLAGRVVASVDQLGNRTTTVYDQWHGDYPATETIDALGQVTTMVSDEAGRNIATIDASGARTSTVYDEADRPIAEIDAMGRITTSVYDSMDGDYPADVTIDALGRLSTILYDAAGHVAAEIDVLGNRTSYTYDSVGHMIAVKNAEGGTTSFTYDAIGQRIEVIDANGNITTTVYDERSLVSATYDPLGHETAYAYDDDGDLIYRRDARGVETNYLRDSLGLVRVVEYETGARVTYAYDWENRLRARADATGITTFAYDAASQVKQVDNPNGQNVAYDLDAFGNRYHMADPNGFVTSYSYDSRQLLSGIVNPFGEVTTIGYDSLGRENYRELANGIIEEREFDVLGRQWKLQQRLGLTPLARYTMTYDEVGANQRQQVAELDGSITTYLYDKTYQLINEHRSKAGSDIYNVTYTYDPAGNRLSQNEGGTLTTYTYDEANRLETMHADAVLTTYIYDQNGNMAGENSAGALTTYTWDEENRLTQIRLPDNSTETYIYSADGLRQRKVKGLAVTDYLRDGQNMLLETTVDASTGVPTETQQQYTDYPGVWGGLVSSRKVPIARPDNLGASPFNAIRFNQPPTAFIPPASRYYGFDQSGNTRLLTDGVGAETDSYVYTAFGKEVDSEGSTINPFRYGGQTGYYRDNDDRLYVRARHLSVGAGKWMSSDPTRFDGEDWNLYRYCNNNPVSGVDASGEIDVRKTYRKAVKAYHNNPVGPWIDKNLLFGSVGSSGDAWGRYDAGRASGWEVAGKSAWAAANVGVLAVDIYSGGKLGASRVRAIPRQMKGLAKMRRVGIKQWHRELNNLYAWKAPVGKSFREGVSHKTRKARGLVGKKEIELHHWLIPQNQWGTKVPNYIKNRDWNLLQLPKTKHVRVDIYSKVEKARKIEPYILPGRIWHGTPAPVRRGVARVAYRGSSVAYGRINQ